MCVFRVCVCSMSVFYVCYVCILCESLYWRRRKRCVDLCVGNPCVYSVCVRCVFCVSYVCILCVLGVYSMCVRCVFCVC